MLFHELVELVLWLIQLFHFTADREQGFTVRISQLPQVRGIHLGMAAETAEILVDHGRV